MLELTVPWEENAEEAHERKKLKYDELVELCKNNGWKAKCTPIDLGVSLPGRYAKPYWTLD